MKSFIKSICLIVYFLSFSTLSFAQVPPVKSDDVLNWKNTSFVAVGRDVVDGAQTVESTSMKIDSDNGERTYAYTAGLVRRSKLFAVLQRGDRILPADRSFDILPKSLSVGEKWKHTTYAGSDRCGKIKYEYEATSTEGPEVVVKVNGVLTKLKTLTVVHEGVWYSAACGGSGRAYLKYIFSPELYELVHIESRYFYNSFLTTGSKAVMESVN